MFRIYFCSISVAPTIGYEKLKPPGSENDKYIQDNERNIKGKKKFSFFCTYYCIMSTKLCVEK